METKSIHLGKLDGDGRMTAILLNAENTALIEEKKAEGWLEVEDSPVPSQLARSAAVTTDYSVVDGRIQKKYRRSVNAHAVNLEIASLKKELDAGDYNVIKAYEASLVGEDAGVDVKELHAGRQAIRNRINELEAKLK